MLSMFMSPFLVLSKPIIKHLLLGRLNKTYIAFYNLKYDPLPVPSGKQHKGNCTACIKDNEFTVNNYIAHV